MKEPFFNDLSIFPLCNNDEEVCNRINNFVRLLEFCGSLGVRKVRFERPFQSIELKKNYTLHEYIYEHGMDTNAMLILSMVRKPYLDDDSPEEAQFVNTVIKLVRDDIEYDAEGLTCAYLSNSFAIGFASEDYWSLNSCFNLNILNQITNKQKRDKVFCISNYSQFGIPCFINYVVCNLNPTFPHCGLKKEEKHVHLRDDHGKDILEKFADKILKEIYIAEVVNSLPFDSDSKDFISKICDDGLIEIRLNDSDKRIGMVLKTTAKNRMEATYMAVDLQQKYG
jgi:hypothetical protein